MVNIALTALAWHAGFQLEYSADPVNKAKRIIIEDIYKKVVEIGSTSVIASTELQQELLVVS